MWLWMGRNGRAEWICILPTCKSQTGCLGGGNSPGVQGLSWLEKTKVTHWKIHHFKIQLHICIWPIIFLYVYECEHLKFSWAANFRRLWKAIFLIKEHELDLLRTLIFDNDCPTPSFIPMWMARWKCSGQELEVQPEASARTDTEGVSLTNTWPNGLHLPGSCT